jgi:CubicO group peptidase (beta-lactamase class C family)
MMTKPVRNKAIAILCVVLAACTETPPAGSSEWDASMPSAPEDASADAATIDVGQSDAAQSDAARSDAGGAPDAGRAIDECGPFDFAPVDAALEALVDEGVAPDIAFTIVRPGCGVLHEAAFGAFDVETVQPIASASKVPSMTLLMTLVDEGLVSLDAPVSTYLGDAWPEDKAAITVRQLMSHRSGLPGNARCLGDSATTLEACAASIAAGPLAAAPGDFLYGGSSYQVAGRIAEVVTGERWNELFASRIGVPCGLERFSYAASSDNPLGSDTNPRVAGGAATDVRDYGRLLLLHLDGGTCGATRVLSEAAVAEMQRDQSAGAPIEGSPYDDGRGYGFGWWLEPADGPTEVWSDAGAFGAKPWIDPGRRYGAVVLIRRSTAAGERIYDAVRPLVEAALLER